MHYQIIAPRGKNTLWYKFFHQ